MAAALGFHNTFFKKHFARLFFKVAETYWNFRHHWNSLRVVGKYYTSIQLLQRNVLEAQGNQLSLACTESV